MDVTRLRRIAGRALSKGGRLTSPRHVEWDIAGRCQDPKAQTLVATSDVPPGRKTRERRSDDPGHDIFAVTLLTRCRQCAPCRMYRKAQWQPKVGMELAKSPRTWMVTLTFDPMVHFQARARAFSYSDYSGLTWHTMSEHQRFKLHEANLYPEVQKYIKRLRKKWVEKYKQPTGVVPLRYVCIAEQHTQQLEGYPHYHLLMHETDWLRPLKWKWLDNKWPWHANASLVDHEQRSRAHWYVTKYLTKQCSSRIRASFAYGRGSSVLNDNKVTKELCVIENDTPAPLTVGSVFNGSYRGISVDETF